MIVIVGAIVSTTCVIGSNELGCGEVAITVKGLEHCFVLQRFCPGGGNKALAKIAPYSRKFFPSLRCQGALTAEMPHPKIAELGFCPDFEYVCIVS